MEYCKGCLSKCAYYMAEITSNKCPCTTCLVKMVCNTECTEYTTFFNNIGFINAYDIYKGKIKNG